MSMARALLATLLLGVVRAQAVTIAVTTVDDELTTDGDCALREAIQAANTDLAVDACPAGSGADVVDLPAGTYLLTKLGSGTNAGDLDLSSELSIVGDGAATTIVDAGNGALFDRVFEVVPGAVVAMSGLTVTGGGTTGAGGGIANQGLLTLADVVVARNTAGGGGGGIFNHGLGTLTTTGSTIADNTAGIGGGGIANNGALGATNCTISGNRAAGGGGIINVLATSTANLTNVTITANVVDTSDGGGVHRINGTLGVRNSLIAGNVDAGGEAPDCYGTITSGGYNLIQSTAGCTIGGDTSGNLTGTDPVLGPLADWGGPTPTHALLVGSPAIDTGDPMGCRDELGAPVATDQRGVLRPQGLACDVGAFEADGPYTTTTTISTTTSTSTLVSTTTTTGEGTTTTLTGTSSTTTTEPPTTTTTEPPTTTTNGTPSTTSAPPTTAITTTTVAPTTTTTVVAASTTSTPAPTTTTSTLPPPECVAGAPGACDDDEPCTIDTCVDGRCAHGAVTGAEVARCVCDRPGSAACVGQAVPPGFTRRFGRACDQLGRAAQSATVRRTRRLVRAAIGNELHARRLVDRAERRHGLSTVCAAALRSLLDEATTRARKVLRGP